MTTAGFGSASTSLVSALTAIGDGASSVGRVEGSLVGTTFAPDASALSVLFGSAGRPGSSVATERSKAENCCVWMRMASPAFASTQRPTSRAAAGGATFSIAWAISRAVA